MLAHIYTGCLMKPTIYLSSNQFNPRIQLTTVILVLFVLPQMAVTAKYLE